MDGGPTVSDPTPTPDTRRMAEEIGAEVWTVAGTGIEHVKSRGSSSCASGCPGCAFEARALSASGSGPIPDTAAPATYTDNADAITHLRAALAALDSYGDDPYAAQRAKVASRRVVTAARAVLAQYDRPVAGTAAPACSYDLPEDVVHGAFAAGHAAAGQTDVADRVVDSVLHLLAEYIRSWREINRVTLQQVLEERDAASAGSGTAALTDGPSRSVVTAEEVTFPGCDHSNPDLCNCATWAQPTCDACDEELVVGDEIFFDQLQGLPWLPAGHRDQETSNWLWHVKCDQWAGDGDE